MKQDVPTRWNSSFEMLQRTFEQKVPLATYVAEFDEIKIPTNYQWGILEKLVYILAPFKNLIKKCGRRDNTCAKIIPSVLALKVLLQKTSSSDKYAGIMTMIHELIKSVTKRLNNFLFNKMLCVSTFLDPRYKLLYQHADENLVIEWVKEAWKEMQGAQDSEKCSEAERELIDIEVADIIEKQIILRSAITQEIDNYLSLPLLENTGCPFLWWSKCGMQFEKLKKMALKYLTASPSSIESESLFSAGGLFRTYTKQQGADLKQITENT
ncbi:zinc finger BED domain-containing protein 4-like [Hydra vulgaris]|uniref:Zinc finger BED domain-containing protein 4-like n=1 Tax=Hydra vulgaris TaxID=6087 RepID=A0ABM4C993_HYDVU